MYGPLLLRLALPGLCGGGRLPDPVGRGQYRDHRFQRRAEPHFGRRRSHRLVPPAASALRHHLPDRQPGRDSADLHHSGEPRQRVPAGRGLRLRRDLELHLQQPGHAGAAHQVQRRARLESAAQHHHRRPRVPVGLFAVFLVLFCTAILNLFTKSIATVAGLGFAGRFLPDLHRFRARQPEQARPGRAAHEGALPVAAKRYGGALRTGHPRRECDGDGARLQHAEPPQVGAGAHRHQRAGHRGACRPG